MEACLKCPRAGWRVFKDGQAGVFRDTPIITTSEPDTEMDVAWHRCLQALVDISDGYQADWITGRDIFDWQAPVPVCYFSQLLCLLHHQTCRKSMCVNLISLPLKTSNINFKSSFFTPA